MNDIAEQYTKIVCEMKEAKDKPFVYDILARGVCNFDTCFNFDTGMLPKNNKLCIFWIISWMITINYLSVN